MTHYTGDWREMEEDDDKERDGCLGMFVGLAIASALVLDIVARLA